MALTITGAEQMIPFGTLSKISFILSSIWDQQEKEYSAQQSAQVIKAYNVLLKPLSRARYLVHKYPSPMSFLS